MSRVYTNIYAYMYTYPNTVLGKCWDNKIIFKGFIHDILIQYSICIIEGRSEIRLRTGCCQR